MLKAAVGKLCSDPAAQQSECTTMLSNASVTTSNFFSCFKRKATENHSDAVTQEVESYMSDISKNISSSSLQVMQTSENCL